MELSDAIFWLSVFIALYGGKSIIKKAKNNNMKNYKDEYCEACECDPCDCGFGSY